jgi:N-acetylglucosamine kinase-like BadF-type ATPase
MLIGIDVGGTKTHIIVDRSGGGGPLRVQKADWCVPTAEWRHDDLLSDPRNADRLAALFIPHLDGDSDCVVVGAHGCDNEQQRARFEQWLHDAVPSARILVLNDSALLAPAAGLVDAVAVVMGTGSIVTGFDASGALISAGGYGGIFADPGSAPAIVRVAVQSLLDSVDAGEPDTLLRDSLFTHFEVSDHVELALLLTTRPSVRFWGSGAPTVFAAADAGSVLADRAIEQGAAELALGVHRVRRQGARGDAVVVAGGVAVHQPRIVRYLTAHLRQRDPELDVVLLAEPPALGALALARRLDAASEPHRDRVV